MSVYISVPGNIETSTGIFNHIVGSLMQGMEAILITKILSANEIIMFQDVHKILNALIIPAPSRPSLG